MIEEWRAVAGHEGVYEVSNLGRVRKIKVYGGRYGTRILSTNTNKKGYCNVFLATGSKGSSCRPIHILVAEAFLGPRPVGLTVNHRDGDKLNNFVENLEYLTYKENTRHFWRSLGTANDSKPFSVETARRLMDAAGDDSKHIHEWIEFANYLACHASELVALAESGTSQDKSAVLPAGTNTSTITRIMYCFSTLRQGVGSIARREKLTSPQVQGVIREVLKELGYESPLLAAKREAA